MITARAHRLTSVLGRHRTLVAILTSAVLIGGIAAAVSNGTRPTAATPNPPLGEQATLLAQVPGLPPGATACPSVYDDVQDPYNAGARGTPMTSCSFVEQVRRAYSRQRSTKAGDGTQQMRVASPSTGKWYDLVCTPTGTFATCTGGVVAVIYLYNT